MMAISIFYLQSVNNVTTQYQKHICSFEEIYTLARIIE